MLVSMLEALETLVLCSDDAPYLRVYGWWVLLQNWGTLRFSDHRGLNPAQITVSAAEFQGTLTRSKTIGSDKNIRSRPVVVSSCCFVREPMWLQTGWKLLSRIADFERDFLLPTPSSNLAGCLQAELRYDTGFAMLNRILTAIALRGDVRILPSVAHFWTPHSSRAFMPSSTAALGFSQEERNFLGGWQAQASDRYARVAKLRVRNMQRAVVETIQKNDRDDPLGEGETFTHLDEFMAQKSHSPEARAKLITALEKWEVRAPMPAEVLEREAVTPEDEEIRAVAEVDTQEGGHTGTERSETTERPAKKKRGGHAQVKTECLGENPKARRAAIRSTLQPGYYICLSGKRRIRTLHRLGACYALPDVDYLEYVYSGTTLPATAEFDTVCKLCARKDVTNPDEQTDASATSSSSCEEEQK